MKKRLPLTILLSLTMLSLLAGLIGFIQLNRPFTQQQIQTFLGEDGDSLVATYLPGSEDIGFLMLEGFGSDQIAMRPAARVML